jgi:hypothetical protein
MRLICFAVQILGEPNAGPQMVMEKALKERQVTQIGVPVPSPERPAIGRYLTYVIIATKLVSGINYVGPLSPIHLPFAQRLLPEYPMTTLGMVGLIYAYA